MADTSGVRGLQAAKAAFVALPEVSKDAFNGATELTVREMVRFAKNKLQSSPSVQTRNLLNAVTWRMNRKTGKGRIGISAGSTIIAQQPGRTGRLTVRVKGIITPGKGGGAAGGKRDIPSNRAHFVEFGTKNMNAEPFMIPAAEDQQKPYLDRCRAAGRVIEKGVAAIGTRTL